MVFSDSSDLSVAKCVWPMVVRKEFGFNIARLPAATPYLGPYWTTDKVVPLRLPREVDYAVFTVHQAAAAWALKSRLRAMATLDIDVAHASNFSTAKRQRLRKAHATLSVLAEERTLAANVIALLDAEASHLSSDRCADILAACPNHTELLGCKSSGGELQGLMLLVYDENTVYGHSLIRRSGSPTASGLVLVNGALERTRALGRRRFDCEAGYLEGIREFYLELGAKPSWYGQARLANSKILSAVEWWRGLRNEDRL